ncbi:hypothetical protein Q3G72_005026 [Acer saccharum]|nr:hypothetical protein Q3G72_005026 [Acer saccharum]
MAWENLLHETPAPQITLLICFICSTKRLPPTPAVDSTHESENSSIGSPVMSNELEQQQGRSMPSPDQLKQSSVMELRSSAPETATPAETQSKLTLPLPVFEFKEGAMSSWKFSKEAPKLSLNSRAVVDAKGNPITC